ncbi:hypothetical protein B0T24DRAFT_631938 [Lasiosphaeria ovina]|uniref:Uncharacterized protein n=1 Tax=Lasiosphaeria ovina TaxID=92902 RepID=A0AAE0N355_9PEZI|nr:hypothetical protein B0T24DRAFT_631938 [Lasiosphaeria ovina]
MPAQSRRPSGPCLPPVDEATVPFSALFTNFTDSFDLATVEATAQLADRSVFVAANGRRYVIQSIPDTDGPGQASGPPTRPAPAPAPVPSAAPAPPPAPTPAVALAPAPRRSTSASRPPPPPRATAVNSPPAASPPRDPRSLHSASIKRRPITNANASPPSPGGRTAYTNGATSAFSPPGSEPQTPTQEMTSMMTQLSVNRFSATPLFGESDGGVQAAEALVEPYTTAGLASPVSPRPSLVQHQQQQQQHEASPPRPYYEAEMNAPHVPGWSSQFTNFDYVNYTAQANFQVQQSRQLAVTPSGLPSLMEYSSPAHPVERSLSASTSPPAYPPHAYSQQYAPYAPYSPYSPYSPVSPDNPYMDAQVNHQSGRGYNFPAPSPTGGVPSPPTAAGFQTSPYVNSVGNGIDTQTPVFVPSPHLHPASVSSDTGSTGRDNVLPGEDVLYDGPVKSALTLTSPVFREGQLKVFRNTLSNDLRFHCKVGHESETFWMKAANAQLVPVYAYDPRFSNVVYIRDNENKDSNGYMQLPQGGVNGRPSGIYQFNRLKELCDFQAHLTAEKVVLDIASVKIVTLSRANTKSRDTYSSVRLQIWHEAEGRKSAQSDVASFVTAGTALSGPLRERLVASSSRLVIYLGRLNQYITLFITDDIEVKPLGQTGVKLKPRKAGALSKKGSRWPGIKAHMEPLQGSEPAGLDIHGQATNTDIESSYDLYKTFEIDFENSPSQDNFIRKWDEVMKERRSQRMKLHQIQEDMEQAVFSGRVAGKIW